MWKRCRSGKSTGQKIGEEQHQVLEKEAREIARAKTRSIGERTGPNVQDDDEAGATWFEEQVKEVQPVS